VVLGGPDRAVPETLGIDGQLKRLVIDPGPVTLSRTDLGAEEAETEAHRGR
jgi:hypothetical protein